jgi:competence protein ComEA
MFAGRRIIDFRNPKTVRTLIVLIAVAGVITVLATDRSGGGSARQDVLAGGTSGQDVYSGSETAQESGTAQGATAVVSDEAADSAQEVTSVATPATIFVDVAGAVNSPLVAELPAGSRVDDAINAAGGVTGEADMRSVNRAAPLADGDRVYIPTTEETASGGTLPASAATAGSSADAGGSAQAAGQGADGRVNINTADSATLQTLNGVGPATAQKIIDYREQHGPFESIEDLTKVSGIGDKTLEKLRENIMV